VYQEQADFSDLISYRPLRREDFKGTTSPERMLAYRLAADRYQGYMKNLRLRAVMDRNCSWWNDDSRVSAAYRLQHEQIHFALGELQVRRLNARVGEISRSLESESGSYRAAGEATHRKWEAFLQVMTDEAIDEARRFDRETSLGYEPAKQGEWWGRVQHDLAETTDVGAGPD
jgi:hypothetical protein